MKRYRKDDTRFLTDEQKAQRARELNIKNPYTERQLDIMKMSALKVGKGEVMKLIKKAEDKGHSEIALALYEKYETLITGRPKNKYSRNEAIEILQDLTPWER